MYIVLRNSLKAMMYGTLFVLSVMAIYTITAKFVSYPTPVRYSEEDCSVNPEFPLLVISTDEASGIMHVKIVFKSKLDQFLGKVCDHSFLVPNSNIDQVNHQVRKQVFSREHGFSGPGEVKILRDTSGKQYLKVTAKWGSDHTYIGWYIATQKAFEPKQFLHYSVIGQQVQALIVSIPIALVLWIIGIGINRNAGKRLK